MVPDRPEHPQATIVVCAHDRWDLTRRCLQAINSTAVLHTAGSEVVLVDDASEAPASETFLAEFPDIRLVRLDNHQGYVKAANAGIRAARGRHVVLLNNDTVPVGAWLDPLLDTLARHPRAGLVGSRLFFPDGRLQEAGASVYSDGTVRHYLREADLQDPRAAFEREVDYCSGACLLIRREFLVHAGGLDERYSPGYYEDVDLAFRARDQGWQVWYQPRSVVEHAEGGSHDPARRRELQDRNRAMFISRWAAALTQQPDPDIAFPGGRERGTGRPRIVVFDAVVPRPDRDGGSARSVRLLAGMRQLGHPVTLVTVFGQPREVYRARLESLGIEVLSPAEDWWEELAARDDVGYVWITRFTVAEHVLDRARSTWPSAAVITDTVDLHHVRLRRAADVLGGSERQRLADDFERRELAVTQASDVAVVVTDEEAAVLGQTGCMVSVVPVVADLGPPPEPVGRAGLLFVGHFGHEPNADGVRWLLDGVLPLVDQRLPTPPLVTIIGSDPPSDIAVRAGRRLGLAVVGWEPDLAAAYARARVVVAPLRFGAGLKTKVVEAMGLGVPVVLTPVAAEGLGHVTAGELLVAATAEEFADAICELLVDDELWHRLSRGSQEVVRNRLCDDVLTEALDATLGLSARQAGVRRTGPSGG